MPVRRDIPYSPWEERLAHRWIGVMNAINVSLYLASDGRVAGRIPSGLPLLLLTTTGRTSGRARTVTVVYLEQDGAYFVVGSNGGLSKPPAWVGNAVADPRVTVRIGATTRECAATVLEPAAADEVIGILARRYRPFLEYQGRAAAAVVGEGAGDQPAPRQIQVLRLDPVPAD